MSKPKVLLYDIERSPDTARVYGSKWEPKLVHYVEKGKILCFAYKWLGDKSIRFVSMQDRTYQEVLEELHRLFDEADLVMGHNSHGFDDKQVRTELLKAGFQPPSPFRSMDTLKIARSQFGFQSNSLKDLAIDLGLTHKMDSGGFGTWDGCEKGDAKAWRVMRKYNKVDVQVLEEVYERLKAWFPSHPSLHVYSHSASGCPVCLSEDRQKRGHYISPAGIHYQRYQCSCGKWYREVKGENAFKSNRTQSI